MTLTHPQARALTYKEAAALVPCDYRTISAAVKAGRIPTIQLGARKLIPRVAFEKYLETGGVEDIAS
ncbi:helix-turn-helix domain-containing protein [Herbiconiux sp. VKM Ac-2851]|uniref:helix-turn-helix domain-containing protein n=1 Tax=Herbiconiux sp. VKM Ac-2851 TaxID=2739025 RepID=UPI0015630ECB|nr:helix-turn-helix domain-containing protein [Herbiconiux sp. VKM Ac-2851]NQX35479.1 helix-turn-helix domain-containing protein [Herbiconiux sp. VKM Ac-2851]